MHGRIERGNVYVNTTNTKVTVPENLNSLKLSKTETELMRVEQDKRVRKLKKTIFRNDPPLLNSLIMALSYLNAAGMTVDELASVNLINGLEKRVGRKIEQAMFESIRMWEVRLKERATAMDSRRFTNSRVYSVVRDADKAHLYYALEYAIDSHMEYLSSLKSFMHKWAGKIKITDRDILSNIQANFEKIENRISYEVRADSGVLLYHTIFTLILLLMQGGEIPFYKSDYGEIKPLDYIDESFVFHVNEFKLGVSNLDKENIQQLSKKICKQCMDWMWGVCGLIHTVNTVFDDTHYSLFNHKVKILCAGYSYDNDLDDLCNQMCVDLCEREALLPTQGVTYKTYALNPFGNVIEEDIQVQYYLNEVITKDQDLYLVMRITDGEQSRFFIYRPADRYFIYTDLCINKYGADFPEAAFAVGISIYKLALSVCLKAKITSIKPVTKQGTGKIKYEEFTHIQGYLRNLPVGYKPSDEAVKTAKNLGLKIGSGQTYVNSFERGVSVREYTPNDSKPAPVDLNELLQKYSDSFDEINNDENIAN